MWDFFDLFIRRPADGLISSLQMLGEDVPFLIKMDAMIGRAIRNLSRDGYEQYRFSRPESDVRDVLESERNAGSSEGRVGVKTNTGTPLQREAMRSSDPPAKVADMQGVVLSGGGAQAAYEVGVLSALLTGQSPSTGYSALDSGVLVGTSAGSINAALLLSAAGDGPSAAAKYVEDAWIHGLADSPRNCGGIYRLRANPLINPSCVFDHPVSSLARFATDGAVLARSALSRAIHFAMSGAPFSHKALELIDLSALISTESFYEFIREKIRLDEIRKSNWKLKIITTNWRSGKARIFDKEEMTDAAGHQILLASSALPGFVPSVEIEGDPYVDGGIVMNTPLKPAIDAGADTLHVIYMDPDISRVPLSQMPSTLDVLARSIEISFRTSILQDIQTVQSVNLDIAALNERTPRAGGPIAGSRDLQQVGGRALEEGSSTPRRLLTVHLYYPFASLNTGWLNFAQENIERLIRRGREDAIQHDCKASHCILPVV